MRSLLFVPANAPRKIARALESGADAVILDLEDSVADREKDQAREAAAETLARSSACKVLVRINPLSTAWALKDLAAVVRWSPDGIVLPKADSGEDVARLGFYLDALEAQAGLCPGGVRVLPIATETPAALFSLGTYAAHRARLLSLTWGAEDLPAALGASANRGEDGGYSDICRLARSLCLAGAAAAGVGAIETVFPAFRDLAGLERYAERGRIEGFTGMMAIHPDQVAVINRAFTPSETELAWARSVVALFESRPGAGALSLDGRMLDRPHFEQARRLLERAFAAVGRPGDAMAPSASAHRGDDPPAIN
jgi:citrate lyase subunit beta/citryl-CoA lyase